MPHSKDENGDEIRLPDTWRKYCAADDKRWPAPPDAPLRQSHKLWQTLLKGNPEALAAKVLSLLPYEEHPSANYHRKVAKQMLILVSTMANMGRTTIAICLRQAARRASIPRSIRIVQLGRNVSSVLFVESMCE